MATTNISTEIVSITGVTAHAASDDFIVSAQKFVVASVPKSLLKWAATLTTAASHGGNTSQGVNIVMPTATDSILDVSRNGFSATEVPYSMKGFIANSSSLYLATNTYPKYYLDNAVTDKGTIVIVKPVPTDSATARVLYVDYTKIDDDCDLRNAVIYHACSSELSKLSTAELPTVSIAAVPPDVPSLATVSFTQSNALSISATSPTAMSLTSVTFTSLDSDIDASLPTYSTAIVVAGGVYGSSTAPAYTKPTLTTPVSFEDFFSGTEDLNPFGDADPGVLSISVSAPSISIVSSGITTTAAADIATNAPTYTKPTQTFDITQFETFLETEEDSELAQVQLGRLNLEMQEYQSDVQNELNEFNKENSKYQASVQAQIQAQQHLAAKNTQSATQTMEALIQDTTLELQKYQAQVNDEVQEYGQKLAKYQLEVNTAFQAWQKTESDRLSQYQADIQSEVNEFNKENVSFQANMQEAVQEIQVANQVNIAKAQGELQLNIDNENRSQQRLLQNGINDMQAIVADNGRKISQYQAEASHYATQVNQYVQNYTSRLQKDMQDTQATIANNDDLVAKYQSELQQYTSEVQAETSEYQNKIQKQQALSKEADKYYQWAKLEVTTYIQNNSKIIAATMARQPASAQA